jgi:hypothetical protein
MRTWRIGVSGRMKKRRLPEVEGGDSALRFCSAAGPITSSNQMSWCQTYFSTSVMFPRSKYFPICVS